VAAPIANQPVANRPEDQRLQVTQVRSAIGSKPKHRGTLRALGLRGIGQSNNLPDRPEIRGMIARVPHLVQVVEVAGTGEPDARP
jgi:large subunit ribosomal protein L30